MNNLIDLARKLDKKQVSSRQLVEHCLLNIENADGEGSQAFTQVYRDRALSEANVSDAARAKGHHISALSGIPISVKDLFDVAGETTHAGSHVLDNEALARSDATIVARLRAAGLIIIGKTNMTEFAYSGLGINAHYGTPASPWDRATRRIPGGSSSGAAVSVSDAMAAGAIGTDTGGSTRIPAALCGITGFKPTSHRIPLDGCIPLSSTLDSIGPLANTVTCCAVLDSIMAGGSGENVTTFPEVGLRLGILQGYPLDDLDDEVARAFDAARQRLSKRGVSIKQVTAPELENYNVHPGKGALIGGEAQAWHRNFLQNRADYYDPWVRERILAADAFSASDYVDTITRRQQCQTATASRTIEFDVLALPTVPLTPRPITDLEQDPEEAKRVNLMYLRNTSIANTLNVPAISIPCHEPGEPPAGFMLLGKHGEDRKLLSIAAGLESIIRRTL